MTKDKRLGRGLAALLGEEPAAPAQPASTPPAPSQPAPVAQAEPTAQADTAQAEPSPPPQPEKPDVIAFQAEQTSAPQPAANTQATTQPPTPAPQTAAEMLAEPAEAGEVMLQLSVYDIDDNPFQPRREFGESEIASLSESLKAHDMLQPVLVRQVDGRYQLISGERRLRAAIQAGWQTVPARVRVADDRLVAELAIVENLQRKDLNPVEKALSFRRYIDEHACTQDDLAKRLKIDRSTIANLMRLLELPDEILHRLRDGSISAGHARALLPLGEEKLQLDFCRQIRSEGWSVRATERNVQTKIQELDGEAKPAAKKKSKNRQVAALEQELKMALGAKVEIRQSGKRSGQIVIHFSSHDEFERLRRLMNDPTPRAEAG